jgi:SRSO17 transposase
LLPAGLPRGVVLMDAGYDTDTDLRTNITALGLSYVAGIQPQTSVWAPGTGPQLPKTWSGCGRPPKLLRRGGQHSINAVAKHQREQRIATMAKQKSQSWTFSSSLFNGGQPCGTFSKHSPEAFWGS